jgi:hypothetical protein
VRFLILSGVITVVGIGIEHVNGTLETIALLGAAVAALGVIHVKVMKPLGQLVRAINRGVDGVLHIEQWTAKVDERLDALEEAAGVERDAQAAERVAARTARAHP